ncbi:cytochrome b2 [Verticillium dahliae VdLs.17]|uniref:Cytochrome b2 n=2 Tax=Verticillium dahliae TaxID=27337 RepID=G2X9R9_VERDV|nr:cytochrome b2 [Verticillium dahliae VdLs.17]EGY15950.1 cytochrome b2 [Verticillium dahliae VdLs.17]KAH6683819.1 cytochrome b2 [Verticillium dahliae]
MHTSKFTLAFASAVLAARPFLNEADNGLLDAFGNLSPGMLPDLSSIAGLPDFDFAARNYLPPRNYTYYRNAAGGEWSYRNNLEVFQRYTFKPRVMRDVSRLQESLATTILGYNFSAPFFIAPCARGVFGHPDAELNLVRGAADEDILYIPSLQATMSMEDIAASKDDGQVLFQQLYLPPGEDNTKKLLRRTEATGAKAIVFTVDAPANGDRQRAYRQRGRTPEPEFQAITWEYYRKIRNMTSLPIVLKGIMSVEDAQAAVSNGVRAIILSNHGGRQLDGSPSSLEVALDIHKVAPEIFKQIEVYADGGVRYGTDVLKLLALGVRAVGVGRPFMYANSYGYDGVLQAIQMLKRQISVDAANLGVIDLKKLDASFVNWTPNHWMG